MLKRLLAILLGITVLPLFGLAYNGLRVIGALVLGVELSIRIPYAVAKKFDELSMPMPVIALLTALIVFPLGVVASAVVVNVIVAYLVFNTVFNMLKSAWLGFKEGLSDGMDGFLHALSLEREELARQLTGVHESELIDDQGFEQIRGELEDVVVVRESLEVPDMESSMPQKLIVLSDTELEQVGNLIEQFAKPQEQLSSARKKQLDALKVLYTQYRDLSQKLEGVRSALEREDKSSIKDELIPYNDVETPILLVKQYKKDTRWFNVPATSYVTDKESLLTWLKQNPRHPLNKDLLKTPSTYKEMPTRYIWYELKAENCFSQELVESANEMRDLIKKLTSGREMSINVRSTFRMFWGAKPDMSEPDPDDMPKASFS